MLLRGSAISGHWQPVPELGMTFLGPVFVNKPGLPLRKVANAIMVLEEEGSENHMSQDCKCHEMAETKTAEMVDTTVVTLDKQTTDIIDLQEKVDSLTQQFSELTVKVEEYSSTIADMQQIILDKLLQLDNVDSLDTIDSTDQIVGG